MDDNMKDLYIITMILGLFVTGVRADEIRQGNVRNFLRPTPTPDFPIGKSLSIEQQLKTREQGKVRELKICDSHPCRNDSVRWG